MHEQHPIRRRSFLAAAGALAAGSAFADQPLDPDVVEELARGRLRDAVYPGDIHRGRCVLASGNGKAAVQRAFDLMKEGTDPLDAIVAGVGIVEADPEDMSVGLGGLPNAEGVVELDASVMHGPTMKAGAVAGLRDIKHPAAVALEVLRKTDHALLVGEGARQFAIEHGFPTENLLTEKAREAWLRWRRNLNPDDDYLDDDQWVAMPEGREGARIDRPTPFTYGTIHCSITDGQEHVSACTTTSGLSYKIPGRVGDSPIVGAGMYVNAITGAAGATGRGEAVIQSCGAHHAVMVCMARGMRPTQACIATLEAMLLNCRREPRLFDERTGRPNFNVTMYALRRDGAYGSAALFEGATFAVCDSAGQAQVLPCPFIYER